MLLLSGIRLIFLSFFFFFNDTATTEIYTLSLHDALPISVQQRDRQRRVPSPATVGQAGDQLAARDQHVRSEEHTSELQSRLHLVCRLLLEKKKKSNNTQQREPNRKRNEQTVLSHVVHSRD